MNTTVMCAAAKSILDKPLHELTEDDISQLTREDCRRYLKEKGMRRPSWNKSQAIQQVISLKSLLEPSLPRSAFRPPVTSSSSSSTKELSAVNGNGSVVALAEDESLDQLAAPCGSVPIREGECLPAAIDSNPLSARSADAPSLSNGQTKKFFSGEVNVYENVSVDKKTCEIMHLASSPIQFCHDEPSSKNPLQCSCPSQMCASNDKVNLAAPDAAIAQSMLSDADGNANRQVSLQRYRKKKKDRGKFKLKRKTGSSSGLEMYLNHEMRMPVTSGRQTQSKRSSPEQLGMLHTGYGFVNSQPNNDGLPVDLFDKA